MELLAGLSFTSTSHEPIIAIVENYTGYLFVESRGIDVVEYALAGTGSLVEPHISSQQFGWYATISCIVNGPCLGGTR